jgi:hypothetical protein
MSVRLQLNVGDLMLLRERSRIKRWVQGGRVHAVGSDAHHNPEIYKKLSKVTGLIAPVLRSFLFGMPPLFPAAVCMSVELATYGAVSALMHRRLKRHRGGVYFSLVTAMVAGRLMWGAAQLLCVGLDVTAFGLSAFWAGAVTTALPGIAVQLVLIPILVVTLEHYTNISAN